MKRERTLWIFAICVAIIATFFITNEFASTSSRTHPNIGQPTKQFSGIEQEAETWFQSSLNPAPSRNQFESYKNKDVFQKGYLDSGSQAEESWTKTPEGIALLFFGYNLEFDRNAPDELSIFYADNNPDIVIVIIKNIGYSNAREMRIDLLKTSGKWKIIWAGEHYITIR